jgi:alpha(1,3/1,4) fucosyltransferase
MKQKLKINFTDFWPRFNKTDNFFWNLLSKQYDLEISEQPDILFYSYFGREFLRYKCFRILFQGENARPDFNECDYAFCFDYLDDPRNYRLPLYAMYADVNLLTLPKDPELIARSKTRFCSFVVSNKYSVERISFFKKLSKYKQVDSGGKYLNNVGGPVQNKVDFIKDHKFTIAFENSSYPGYTTEKIFEPMLVNSIPLYWGNPLVGRDFNTKSFLNAHEYPDLDAFIEKIIEIDNNRNLYLDMLAQPYFVNNKINEYVKEENIRVWLDKIIEIMRHSKPVATLRRPNSELKVLIKTKAGYYKQKIRYIINWPSLR